MDTSETYIKMRIAAIPDLGRGKSLESTFRSENCYKFENDVYSVFVSVEGDWYTFHPSIEFDKKQGRTCQLERQDQLQEMIGDYRTVLESVNRQYRELGKAERKYWGLFTSMEQAWLAFVLKEKFGKIWNNEEWVIT